MFVEKVPPPDFVQQIIIQIMSRSVIETNSDDDGREIALKLNRLRASRWLKWFRFSRHRDASFHLLAPA
jgi:hypothetical protein